MHRIARAVLEDRLAPFERTLLEQLGTNAGLGAHFAHWGYAGPLVFAHDSTAARPYADVRVIDQAHVEVDCFVSGPVRRQSVEIDDLQAGQRGFLLKSNLISFVARDITWRASTVWIPSLPMTSTPLQYNGDLMRATSKLQMPAKERLELALGAMYFILYSRMLIELTKGYKQEENFTSDQCYHDQILHDCAAGRPIAAFRVPHHPASELRAEGAQPSQQGAGCWEARRCREVADAARGAWGRRQRDGALAAD